MTLHVTSIELNLNYIPFFFNWMLFNSIVEWNLNGIWIEFQFNSTSELSNIQLKKNGMQIGRKCIEKLVVNCEYGVGIFIFLKGIDLKGHLSMPFYSRMW